MSPIESYVIEIATPRISLRRDKCVDGRDNAAPIVAIKKGREFHHLEQPHTRRIPARPLEPGPIDGYTQLTAIT